MAARERWWIVQQPGRAGWLGAQVVSAPSRPANAIGGPYPTKAAAEEELADRTQARKSGPPLIPNPLSGLSSIGKIAHWIGDAVLHAVDLPMWRSLGWIALGAVLLMAGIYLWFRTSATYKDLQSAVLGTVKAL